VETPAREGRKVIIPSTVTHLRLFNVTEKEIMQMGSANALSYSLLVNTQHTRTNVQRKARNGRILIKFYIYICALIGK
jgi:hypothetical protein